MRYHRAGPLQHAVIWLLALILAYLMFMSWQSMRSILGGYAWPWLVLIVIPLPTAYIWTRER